MRQNATQKAVQQSYPTLTGQQLTGAQSGPQTGEMIKNLMLYGERIIEITANEDRDR